MADSRRAQFFVIFLTILLSTIGFGVCIPVLPLYAMKFGATEFENGLLTGVFSIMVFIAAPLWGRLSDRIGRRPVLLFSIIGSAAGYFLMGTAHSLWLLYVARIIDGASGGNVATAQAYIADITRPEERSKAMGMIGAAFGLGFVIGPAIGGYLSAINAGAPFLAVGGLCLVNAVLVVTSVPESLSAEKRHAARTARPLSDLLGHADSRNFVNVAASYFMNLMAFSIMTAIFSLFAEKRFAMTATDIGHIMAAIGIVGVLMQGGVIRRLLPRYGEVVLARTGFVLLLVSFVLLPLVGGSGALYWVSCLIAVGNSLVQPTLNGLASRSVEASWQGRAMGLLQAAGSLGRGAGPVLGGWLLGLDRAGPVAHYGRTPFWIAAVLMVATLVLAMRLRIPQTAGANPDPGSRAVA